MVTANPTDVIEVVRQVITKAFTEAGNSQQLKDIFTQIEKDVGEAGDQVKLLKEIPKELKDLVDHPDWWSLLVFLVVKIKDSIGDPHLSIGYRHPEGWSRMLTLNYSNDPTNLEGSMAASLGVAVTDPGVKHGFSLQIIQPLKPVVKLGSGALQVDISADGAADWQYVLGATMPTPNQSVAVHCNVDLRWQPWGADSNTGSDVFEFRLGPLHLNLALSSVSTDPLYTVTIGLGADSVLGVKAAVHPAQAFGPALGSFIHVGGLDESYSPQLTVVAGGSPRFDLGHNGNG
jgi:hypothetical protein